MAGGRQFAAEIVTNLNVATQSFMDPTVSLLSIDDVIRARLMKKSKSVDGGDKIEFPLRIDKENVTSVGKYDPYNLQPKEILDKAYYDWRFVRGDMSLALADVEVINSGKAKIIDIARTKVENMRDSMNAEFSTIIYKSVATMKTTDPDSLIKIAATQNNTCGGINAAVCVGGSGTVTQPFAWNPKVIDYSAKEILYSDMVTSASDYYILKLLRKLVSQLTIGNDKPTLLIGTQVVYDAYEEVLIAQKRYDSAAMKVDGGFDGLLFRGVPLVVDNNCPGGSLNTSTADYSGMILALNENYIGFKHSSAYGKADGQFGMRWTPWLELETQPILHSKLEWAGCLGCNRRDRQGALLGIPSDAKVYA